MHEMKDRNMLAEKLAVRSSDECGCPEEDWDINGVFTTLHLEPNGGGHIFLYVGDWDDEKLVPCTTIEELRRRAIEWVSTLCGNQ